MWIINLLNPIYWKSPFFPCESMVLLLCHWCLHKHGMFLSPFHSTGRVSSPSISTTRSSSPYCHSLHLLLPAHLAFQEPRLFLTFHSSILILGLACKLPQNKQVSWGFREPRLLQNRPRAWEVPCACYFPRVSRKVLPVTVRLSLGTL